jgi:hypothetical protein
MTAGATDNDASRRHIGRSRHCMNGALPASMCLVSLLSAAAGAVVEGRQKSVWIAKPRLAGGSNATFGQADAACPVFP